MLVDYEQFRLINDLPRGDIRVVVAMSGGVDSSVAAALMVEAGYDVIGVTMKLYNDNQKSISSSKTCCTGSDIKEAQNVAKTLGIKHYVLDFQVNFKEKVIDDFINNYQDGKTPIPCIRCNQTVKFTDLVQFTKSVSSKILVTGHYVRRSQKNNKTFLYQASDTTKDQSYFLFSTTKQQLDLLRFPLGNFKKTEIRALAKKFGLSNYNKPDSQDICFVPKGDYKDFIRQNISTQKSDGKIINQDNEVIGKHDGIYRFTVGQRRGIGLGGIKGNKKQNPLYVLEIDRKENQIKVGHRQDLEKYKIYLKDTHIIGQFSDFRPDVDIKLRSSQKKIKAKVNLSKSNNKAVVELANPAFGVSPGQACVFYKNNKLLGGGWIVAAEKN